MTVHVVAMGGGGFSMSEGIESKFDQFVLGLVKPNPVVCFVPTASGDSADYIERFEAAFAGLPVQQRILRLFGRETDTVEEILDDVDIVYVGGGNTANLLAVWRLHGVDRALKRITRDVVLTGVSAGANCWFDGSTTDSYGPTLRALADGIGFVGGSFCPHYDSEAQRSVLYPGWVADRTLPDGYAADDYAAVHFADGEFVEAISERDGAAAYRVTASDVQEVKVRAL